MGRTAPTKTRKRTISIIGGFAIFLAFLLMGLGYGDGRTAATSKDDIRLEQVRIEVLLDDPGGHKPAEPGATVRVAILSTESFDATSIDPASITIEGVPVIRRQSGKARASIQDVNGDDLMDLVVRVNAEGLHITTEPKKIAMQGATLDGRPVQGGGCVRSSGIPCAGELLSPADGKSRSGKAGKKNVSIAAVNATIVSAGATLVSESCTPPNGALDPNETVTVSFCIQNTGVGNTTKLIGTLQATGGVTNPSGPQDYGVVVAGGPPVCRNVTFTVTGTCGGTITASIQFQDGATNLGTVTYTFTLGTLVVVFQENFDGVTEPALPAGWTPSQGVTLMGGPLWVTSTTTPDTAPNDAFSTAPNHTFDNRLDTPLIAILTGSAQLSFRNNFDLNDSGGGADGAVLEISSPNIESGDFTGITAAGGSFVSGGYNMTIPEDQLSVIAGRSAWSGTSGGYVTTVVNLPAAVAGQSITLRFRLACDHNVASVGWRIDTVRITDGFVCSTTCPAPACTITCPGNITQSNDSNQCGAVVNYAAPTTTGTCGTPTCSPASGSTFPKGTSVVTCTVTAGPSCTFTVTVNDTQLPTITCPANVTVSNDPNQCAAVVNYPPPTVSDNCPGVGTPLCSPASGSGFPVGTTTVTCTVSDASGNTASCPFTITVNDTQPPSITCPANITAVTALTCPATTSAVVNFTTPTATDNCSGVTVICVPPSGAPLPVGTTTVTCTATDASGNTATCSFTVSVFDVCLQDDSDPSIKLLINGFTGDYRFICHGTIFTGRGTVTGLGCDKTLVHNPSDRRVLAKWSSAVKRGSASIQSPPGTIKCTIRDSNMTNNDCATGLAVNGG